VVVYFDERWFSLGTPVSSTNKTACQNMTEILLKVVLNTITLTLLYEPTQCKGRNKKSAEIGESNK